MHRLIGAIPRAGNDLQSNPLYSHASPGHPGNPAVFTELRSLLPETGIVRTQNARCVPKCSRILCRGAAAMREEEQPLMNADGR
jgi:hypothetical protein